MTYEEAIETIKIAIAEVEWNYPMEYSVAFEKAIEALEKQIPKMPDCEGNRLEGMMQEKKAEQIYEKVKLRKELNYLLEDLARERKGWNLNNYMLLCTHNLSEEASDCLREIIAEKIYCIDCELEDI